MERKTTRAFTPARIVALALVALAVLALGYLRFAPEDGPVSVPAGAQAGDIVLEPCDYETEDGTYAADCGTLVVPENRADPDSRLIALPVTRIKAETDDPGEPVFYLEGGPGGTNMEFPGASRFAGDRDVVLVGYRGVDGSERLDCPEVESALAHSTDYLGDASFRAYEGAFRVCASRLADEGVDVSSYGLVQQVDDLEDARKALGYERIDLLSESAGTRTALIYAWRYPESIHRSVLVAANPPGHFLWDAKTTDEQIARYAKLCADDASCSERTDDLAASLARTNEDIPDRWAFLPIQESSVRIASFFGLMESTSASPVAYGPQTIDSWLSAAEGDPSGFWFASLAGELIFPKMFVWGQYAAAGRVDAAASREYFAGGADPAANLGTAASAYGWGGGRMADGWPAAREENRYSRMRTSEVETLVISGELDGSTPPQVATAELMPYLPNGEQVVLRELGHTADFWAEQPEASSRLVNTYLASGRVDASLYERGDVDFSPPLTQVRMAKIVLGLMLAFVVVAAGALLAMARRVRRRGGFGRKAGAVLRSVLPLVLGLGGWFAGVLVVLTAMPGVPLDDEVLAAISIGVPIGFGVYLAWVQRAWSAAVKATGLAAAVSGALVGAWLGFNATEGLVAIVATIVGAAAGANLVLLVLDIAWDRQEHDRFADAGAPLQARPTTG